MVIKMFKISNNNRDVFLGIPLKYDAIAVSVGILSPSGRLI